MKFPTRRFLQPGLSILLAGSVLTAHATAADDWVYFGSHGSGARYGFFVAHFETETGKLTVPKFILPAVAPAYFVITPDGKRLCTCNSAPGDASRL